MTKDKALFTIVVSGTDRVLQQVVEQLNKVVNVLEVTGDPGKMVVVQRYFCKFGIKELATTGKIALRWEKMGESAPFWRFSAASYPDLGGTMPIDSISVITSKALEEQPNLTTGRSGVQSPMRSRDAPPI